MESEKRRFPNVLLVTGVLLFVVGGCLLLLTSGVLPGLTALWPVLFIVGGFVLLYLAFVRRVTEFYVFPGMFMGLGGLYFVLGEGFLAWRELLKVWPVFMAITGASIIPYGLLKRGNARVALVIPGIAILLLALIFLPFSLGVIRLSFAKVAVLWWPVLLVALGLIFLASHFLRRRREKT